MTSRKVLKARGFYTRESTGKYRVWVELTFDDQSTYTYPLPLTRGKTETPATMDAYKAVAAHAENTPIPKQQVTVTVHKRE